jgi:hypothetical protein
VIITVVRRDEMADKTKIEEEPREDLAPRDEREAKEGGPVIQPVALEDPEAPRAQPDPTPVFGGKPGDPPPGQSLFPENRPPDPGQPLPGEE